MNNVRSSTRKKHTLLAAVLFAGVLQFQLLSPLKAAAFTDIQPPSVPTRLCTSDITHTSITLNWAAASDNTGVKGYRVYRDGRKIKTTSKTYFTNIKLIPGKMYSYTVRAYDAAGNTSGDSTAITAATAIDTQNPTRPSEPVVMSKTYTSITLSWNASKDNTILKGYEIYCNNKKVSATSSTYHAIKGLLPGKAYSFYLKAYDIAGNYSAQSNTITASTVPDNTAPSIPAGLRTSSVTGTEINITWSPSSDNVKVKSYEVFCNGIKLSSSSKTSLCSKKLIPGRSYTYTIRALDAAGNISGLSIPFKVSTLPDCEAPAAPSGLKVKSATRSSASLTWNASTDNIKVKGYIIYCNGIIVAETSKTHYTVKSPFRLGIDIFYIKAYDLVGNVSGGSNKVTAITL